MKPSSVYRRSLLFKTTDWIYGKRNSGRTNEQTNRWIDNLKCIEKENE